MTHKTFIDKTDQLIDFMEEILHSFKEVKDDEGINRKPFFVTDKTVAMLGTADKGDVSEIKETTFHKSVFMLEGKAKIVFDDGREVHLDAHNDFLKIDVNDTYKVETLEDGSSAIVTLRKDKDGKPQL